MNANRLILLLLLPLMLAACEQLGLEDPVKVQAAREAEGRATGSACRHSGRALEDCYEKNGKVSRAAIFAGWREMDEYMRENKIETVKSSLPAAEKKDSAAISATEESAADKEAGDKAAETPPSGEDKPAAKGKKSALLLDLDANPLTSIVVRDHILSSTFT